ncbi:MAG TPA: NADH-quinone oxidoreductase subunit NuoN [Bacillales bacterium]|nr:NADH-quinone oxidoreductase subunit NuoN [Bacillales bacterium]
MDLETLLSFDWGKMAPEFTILIAAVALSLIDLFVPRRVARRPFAWLALLGVAVAFLFCVGQIGTPVTTILAGTYRLDSFAVAFKLLLLIGTGFVLLMSSGYDQKGDIRYRGEFYYLLLTALLGAMMLTSSADMITLFVSLELLSLSSYIMAGLRKNDPESNEAALKYVINGGIATAVFLFGMSYIYGLSGTTNLYEMAGALAGQHPLIFDHRFLLVFAYILIFVGFSFKLTAVPFHMWAPDVYEGAPTPVTAFLSVVSKTAGFVLVLRFLILAFMYAPGIEVSAKGGPELVFQSAGPYIAVFASLAMVIGNTAALKQKNMKRLFAYSGIAQAGYVLVPFVSLTQLTIGNVWFYLFVYLFMNLGAFAVIQTVAEKEGNADISGFTGLSRRSPWMAAAMAVFLISLAGIPATAGFIGKFNILVEAVVSGRIWLASVMIGTTVISYFYYFGVIVKMYQPSAGRREKTPFSPGAGIVVWCCVIGTLAFGLFPDTALGFLHDYLPFNSFFESEIGK